jgi:hypothetical protein
VTNVRRSGASDRSGIVHHLVLVVELVEFDSTHGGFERVHVRILATGQSEVDVGLWKSKRVR